MTTQTITLAIRTYPLDDMHTGIEYVARDIVSRNTADNSLVINYTTNGMPGEEEGEAPMTMQRYFEWLRELPEQIEFVAV